IALIASPLLDIDNNGEYDALTDGLILIRYLFGLSGNSMTASAIGQNARRTDPGEILAYLQAGALVFDVDGNGQIDALTDGLLVLRYLFGIRGNALINNAIGTGATRSSPTDIENYIQLLMP